MKLEQAQPGNSKRIAGQRQKVDDEWTYTNLEIIGNALSDGDGEEILTVRFETTLSALHRQTQVAFRLQAQNRFWFRLS